MVVTETAELAPRNCVLAVSTVAAVLSLRRAARTPILLRPTPPSTAGPSNADRKLAQTAFPRQHSAPL